MNERQLRYLSMIAEKQTIQQAASMLSRNSSTLTRMLKKTEEDLGVTIFLRTPSGLVPTPEGEQVLIYVQKLINCYDRMREWIDGGPHGRGKPGGHARLHDWSENEIRYLLTVREQRNISRAAKELYLAQPSLSQMILDLERDLEQQIFVRTKAGVDETGFGTGLLDRLEEIQELHGLLRAELEKFRQMKKGTITIGIPMNLGTYLLPLFLPVFCERYPGIQVRIRENNTSELERLLLAKKIDFCIMHEHEKQESVAYESFSDDPFFLVIPVSMSRKFSFPKDRALTTADLQPLKSAPFIMVARRQKLRLVVDGILGCAGITPYIRCTTRSMETAKRLVAAGMGVTFLPYSYLTLYSGVEGLESYPLDTALGGSWKLVAAYLRKGNLSRSAQEFLRMMKECLTQQIL